MSSVIRRHHQCSLTCQTLGLWLTTPQICNINSPGFHGGDKGVQHPLNAQQQKLSDQIVAGWTNFARYGNPNGKGPKIWPDYSSDPNAQSYLSQDIPELSTFSNNDFTAMHKCDFWKDVLVYK
ncbi:carboxylesterase family protein [Vibrio olivae]